MTGLHRRRKRRPTSTPDYMAMLSRMIRAAEPRIGQDPAGGLLAAWHLETAWTEATNVGVYLAHRGGKSYGELAALMGVSKAAVIKRAQLGETTLQQRQPGPRRLPGMTQAKPRELETGELPLG
jgi:DNA-directed RNA polymerase specialized sigma24 family protein